MEVDGIWPPVASNELLPSQFPIQRINPFEPVSLLTKAGFSGFRSNIPSAEGYDSLSVRSVINCHLVSSYLEIKIFKFIAVRK
jgi:hypothetical protein